MKAVKCIANCNYESSLILGKVYNIIAQDEEEYSIIDEDGEVFEYAKWRFEEIDVIEPNEVFSKLINKELMDGDEIIISSEVFTYQYGKIQNAYGEDLTV